MATTTRTALSNDLIVADIADHPASPAGRPVKKSIAKVETPVMTSPDLHIVKTELYDPDVMDGLLRSVDAFSKTNLTRLRTYKKGRKHGNAVEVVYHYGKGCEALKCGRLYAKDNQGLQSFPFDMRNPLIAKHYWDIDMENAHYWLMKQSCEKWGLKCDAITQYCLNREAELTKVSSNRRTAKTAFLKVAYGGNIKLHNEHFNDDGIAPDGDITLLKAIEKEIAVVIAYLKSTETPIYKLAEKKTKKGKEGNTDFTFLALVLQSKECMCLLALDEFMRMVGRSVDILIHDGCEVRKLEGESEFPTALLRGAEAHILSRTGFQVKLVNKPIRHDYEPPTAPAVSYDDEYAARALIAILGDKIQRDEKVFYIFDEDTGMWDNSDASYRRAIQRNKDSLIFRVNTPEGEKVFNYGGCEKNVVAMKNWILPSLEDTKFISNGGDTSYGKLLFKDGIYDFLTDTFTPGFNPAIVFNKRIDRPYPTTRNADNIAFMKHTLFVSAFADADGLATGEYLRKALCMGLVGDYVRKKFYFGLGEANCGKGVLVSAFRAAFEGYCDEWVANELKYNSRNSQDEARRLAWLKDLAGVRIAFSNELRMDNVPIDGNLLKSVSSGGDEVKARGNYQDATRLVNRASMFLLANDMLPIKPCDSGIQERCRFIRYKLRFVSEGADLAADERVADPMLKSRFEKAEIKDALFHLMVDTYAEMTPEEKTRGGALITPESVLEETKEWIGDDGSGDFKEAILKRYEITGVETDSVPSAEIIEYITHDRKMALSANKVGRLITKMVQEVNKSCRRDRNPEGDEEGKQRCGIRQKSRMLSARVPGGDDLIQHC